jgi:PhzF family phenazine biosynthesis protein
LEDWLPDEVMQKIAAENNLAETAFFVREGVADGGGAHGRGNRFHLRWFTPTVEVDLCGHATLASAHVLFEHLGFSYEKILFSSRSGELMVSRESGLLQLNFPADTIRPVAITDAMRQWFSALPVEAYKGRSDYMLVFDGEPAIEGLQADLAAIEKAKEARGVIVTAKGDEVDFVSRFFAPQSGIAEDPVTGSAHTTLTPYWSARLGKKELDALQLSARRGFLHCRDLGDRIAISAAAKTYMEGLLYVSTSSGNPTRILR